MGNQSEKRFLSRRAFLGASAALGMAPAALPARIPAVEPGAVRDRLWLFTVPANTDFRSVQRRSLMTPVEAGCYFEVPNLIVVQASAKESEYGRFEPPLAQYAIAMRPFRRVVWSIVGSGGFTDPAETEEVLNLVRDNPNFQGIMLDDFFLSGKDGKRAVLPLEELRRVRERLASFGRRLDIFATYYTRLLEQRLDDYLSLIDVLTFWTWRSAELVDLEKNLDRLERVAPGKRVMVGCYLYDFNEKRPVSVQDMRFQCETCLRLLKARRIEGIIFLANTLADLGFESAEWTRAWVREVGDQKA